MRTRGGAAGSEETTQVGRVKEFKRGGVEAGAGGGRLAVYRLGRYLSVCVDIVGSAALVVSDRNPTANRTRLDSLAPVPGVNGPKPHVWKHTLMNYKHTGSRLNLVHLPKQEHQGERGNLFK